ncbi:MAG TPA: methyltransferase domain-containing protein [Solirubrobacteraceae bacterium]|nr:methyltransferase domain-containing protein [Solirubrobacteraceae bacterium]
MSSDPDPEDLRADLRDLWERSASGWGERAAAVREWGMPVSSAMIDRLNLQPGQRVLELAAGPGDTGFLAAEIVAPGGGVVISSDGAQAMVEVARRRAQELGIRGVEFRQLELELIDRTTADVDRILCRWGLMLIVDPAACLTECRRVLRPGGRIALAVWDAPEANPWMSLPRQALADVAPSAVGPPAAGPGPFALASAEQVRELLEAAGFFEVTVEAVELVRQVEAPERFLEETLSLSEAFRRAWDELDGAARDRLTERMRELCAPLAGPDGIARIRGRSLVAAASA